MTDRFDRRARASLGQRRRRPQHRSDPVRPPRVVATTGDGHVSPPAFILFVPPQKAFGDAVAASIGPVFGVWFVSCKYWLN